MDQRLLAAALPSPLPCSEGGEDQGAGDYHEGRQRESEWLDRRAARNQPSPVARLQDAEDHDPEASGGENPADPVERGRGPGPRRLADQPQAEEDAEDADDLTGE